MSTDSANEVYRQFRTAQDKYAYFLLAAAGAGIALAVNQTNSAALAWYQVPLGGATLMWAASFFFGCRHIANLTSFLYSNCELIKVEKGEDPMIGAHPQIIVMASERIHKTLDENSKRAFRYAKFQFHFLVSGAVLYLVWHILEMWLRSI